MKSFSKNWLAPLISFFILIIADQLSKWWIYKNLFKINEPNKEIEVVGDFFKFQYSENYGIAFGIDIPQWFIVIFALIILPLMIYLISKEFKIEKKLTKFSLVLILAGAIGNIIDRFTYGFVVDFIRIWEWPNFNIADICIVTGVLMILVFYGKMVRKNPDKIK